ncbi:hypothetical protein AQJ11_03350 [Streptomyces corchorusii]|uniref:Uncharacterized protein n=2 Tax=Streptomyces TaxID=1883 RepID=A0A101QMC7_STRCK|nr:hypothetical protein [Streptomyces corchorusii]KUN32575.1 hypothetical protein AQJ11_03350 [Streptomyces corchorusii]
MTQFEMPAVDAVAGAAREILDTIKSDREFPAFRAASLEYSEDWQCFTGFPVVERWNLEADSAPLFEEGLRALALKAAVWGATGDDQAAEIPIAVPVDEMTHAMLAQSQLLARIAARSGVSIIHQTDQEHTDYRAGGYTHDCYRAAWGEPPARYWLDHEEVVRRRDVLAGLYQSIGMGRSGREHGITFAPAAA